MCGIVGWISREGVTDSIERKRFMDQALIIDTVRGWDSAGAFVVESKSSKNISPAWFKQLGSGFDLVSTNEYQELFMPGKTQGLKFAVGHNRSATQGAADNVDAAHPFQEGPITLVHNGTVFDTSTLGKSKFELKAENDSHTICHNLALYPAEEVISKINGAFALVWYDSRDDSLNMVRNNQRPMHLAKAKKNNTIYFCSEAEMLHLLDKRLTLGLDCIVSLKPGFWLKFKDPDLMIPEVKEVKFFTPPVYTTTKKAWHTGSTMGWNATQGTSGTSNKNLTQQYYDNLRTKPKALPKPTKNTLIPDQLQLELCDFNMDIESVFNFAPMHAIKADWFKRSGPTYTVFGRVLTGGNKMIWGVIHGVMPHAWEDANSRLWSITPVGRLDQGWEDQGIVARLKSTLSKDNQVLPLLDADKALTWPVGKVEPLRGSPKSTKRKTEPKGGGSDDPPFDDTDGLRAIGSNIRRTQSELEAELGVIPEAEEAAWEVATRPNKDIQYPGPGHRSLTYDEWCDATAGGCCGCGEPFAIHDAWSLEWVNGDVGGKDPLCIQCQRERDGMINAVLN